MSVEEEAAGGMVEELTDAAGEATEDATGGLSGPDIDLDPLGKVKSVLLSDTPHDKIADIQEEADVDRGGAYFARAKRKMTSGVFEGGKTPAIVDIGIGTGHKLGARFDRPTAPSGGDTDNGEMEHIDVSGT